MQVLWSRGPATVAQVQQALQSRQKLAYTTVATLLARMEQKGLVRHRSDGRAFVYSPRISQERAGNSLVSELVRRAFDGSASRLVSHLLETEHVDREELKRIKKLVDQHQSSQRLRRST